MKNTKNQFIAQLFDTLIVFAIKGERWAKK